MIAAFKGDIGPAWQAAIGLKRALANEAGGT